MLKRILAVPVACLAFAVLLPGSTTGQTAAKPPAARQPAAKPPSLPPLIDREVFFGDPEIAGAQISPDGQFIAFLKPFKGTRNIWVKGTAEPFGKARPMTAETKRPISSYFWSRDAKFILYVQDQGGDENYNVYAVDPSAAPASGADVPPARNITDVKGVAAQIYAVPRSEPDAIYVGLNDRDKAWHDVYKVRISTGERTLVAKNTDRFTGVVLDLKDQLRLVTRSAENGDTETLRVDPENKFAVIYRCNVFETCDPLRFHKDGRRVYFQTNKGADLIRLVLLDVESGKEELVETDPLNRVDLGRVHFSEVTDEMVATTYVDDKPRHYFKDKDFEADYTEIRKRFPTREVAFASCTRDERRCMVNTSSDVEPGETFLFDRQAKKLTLQYRIREKLTRSWLASMQAIRYKSSDGLEIPAYLTLPRGIPGKGLPLVVVPHGGPWARDDWGPDALAQFYANRGYAVLMPNFRGSTGYGRRFLDAGNKQWGDKMQDDITWGVKYLVSQGIADPKRVGIMGGSYGGYATLAGVAFTPDLYAAAVSLVGPSNLITLLESIPPYWEQGRKVFYERMGDPSTPEGKSQLERQSPLNSADKIRTPLLVIQGANDPRVNKRESDQIVVALRDRGFPVEYIVAPDEGHGFARPVNNMAAFAAAEKFLARYLGGRYQQTMTPEVAERLKEITVDPNTVKVTRPAALTTATVPKPVAPLVAGVYNYKGRIELGGQALDLPMSTEIKEEAGSWVIVDSVKSPAGSALDHGTLEKTSLVLRTRTVTQGPATIKLDLAAGGKVTGTADMGGGSRPLNIDAGGDFFADGPGGPQVIATLPLTAGYRTAFRNLDIQTLKVKVIQLAVTGSERVTVPAGVFDAWKVDLTSDDGSAMTLWIDKIGRKVAKVTATLPQMNGAKLTAELLGADDTKK